MSLRWHAVAAPLVLCALAIAVRKRVGRGRSAGRARGALRVPGLGRSAAARACWGEWRRGRDACVHALARKCNPEWDGRRALLGGSDQAAIEAARGRRRSRRSFGGWSGRKLGSACKTAATLAAAYQKVIDASSLRAIDIDIEHGEYTNKKTRVRVIEALASVQRANPGWRSRSRSAPPRTGRKRTVRA